MDNLNFENYKLPEYWASALVNGDYSGYDDAEEREIAAWLDAHPGLYCVCCAEESEHTHWHDAGHRLLTACLDFTFQRVG